MSTPRFHDGMRLVSTRTAINRAGLFVVSTLTKWGVRTILRSVAVETEESVTTAINATGIPEERMHWTELTRAPEYIIVQLYDSLGAFASRCGTAHLIHRFYRRRPSRPQSTVTTQHREQSSVGGIALLPQRPSRPPQPLTEQFRQDPDLLRRVRDGLEKL